MKPMEHIVDIIIAIIVLILFPLLYFGQKKDSLTVSILDTSTSEFVDEVRGKGYLNKTMYEEYIEELSHTGLLYDIHMEHSHRIQEPEYRFRTAEEIIEDQNSSYTGENSYTYRPIHTDVPSVHDPINDGNLNTETNESVLRDAIHKPPSPDHIHTEECYLGHRHSDEADNVFIHTHKHNYQCIDYVRYTAIIGDCTSCGTRYQSYFRSAYWDSATNSAIEHSSSYYNCPTCGSNTLENEEIIMDYGYSCGYDKDMDGDGWGDRIDRSITQTYEKPYPQDTSISSTHTSGCYTYHISAYPPREWNSTENQYYYYDYSVFPYLTPSVLLERLQEKGFHSYCEVPKYYEFRYAWYDGMNRSMGVTYRLEDASGDMRFVFSSGYNIGSDYSFPDLTLTELVQLSYSYSLYTFFNTYTSRYPSSSGTAEVVSLRGVYEMHPHTIPSDRWVLTCGEEAAEDGSPVCGKMVVKIEPTHKTQTVYINDPLITTVTAYYKDGSTKVLIATSNFSTANVGQNQTATLTHTYTVGETSYSKTCTITVTVIPRNKTCGNGHPYNLNPDGTDPGCPYCKAWLKSLEVVTPASGTLIIYKGTSLEDNGVVLLATYLDGHKEYLTSGYVDNLDKNYVGTQTVTISYKGKNTFLTVTTKRNLTRCSICNRYYELYPDDTDPGCPYCLSLTPIFTGNVLEYVDKKYIRDILNELYEGSGTYYFNEKDYFTITLRNRSRSLGEGILTTIFKNIAKNSIHSTYGGYIREEGK